MLSPASVTSEHYRALTKLLRELHRLIRDGEGDSDAADELRDVMDMHWRKISQDECDRVCQMAADLNSLDRPPAAEPSAVADAILPQLREAERAGDWLRLLAMLLDHPGALSMEDAAFVRGRCWSALGDPETAALFFEHAAEHDPRDRRPAMAPIGSDRSSGG